MLPEFARRAWLYGVPSAETKERPGNSPEAFFG